MANKITKKDRFNQLLSIAEVSNNEELTAFIKHELELLEKKNSADRKPTKAQVENEELKTLIYDSLSAQEKPVTISELQSAVVEVGEMSNQKVSALIRQLVSDGLVKRTEEKRKAYFSV